MNILFITHEINMGGASKSLVTLASELQNEGHKVVVILPFIKGQVYEELKKNNIRTHLLFYGWRVISSDWSPIIQICFKVLYVFENLYVANISRFVKKYKINIIHSNSSVIDVGIKTAIVTKVSHVWHYREFQDFYNFKYIPTKDKRLKILDKAKGQVIFISHKLKEYYRDEVFDSIGKVIYNGIPANFLIEKYKDGDKFTRKTIKFLLAGNFHRKKRHDVALDAAKILYEKGYKNFEICLAGAVANTIESVTYEKEIRRSAADLSEVVRFVGFVDDMIELRKKIDIELVCSQQEAFGRVTAEAMMASNPVIASNSGANLELIQDRINGRLFIEGDPLELSKKMQWFIDEPANIAICGKNAYLYAKENFLSCINTQNVMEVYNNLIGMRSKENKL